MSASPEPEHKPAAVRHEGYFGGAGLLAADTRVVSLFAGEARRRTMRRLFGIPVNEPSGMATLIALLTLVAAMRRHTTGVSAPGPTLPGVITGIALVKELAHDIAGPSSRESSYFGALLAFALIGGAARAAARGSTRRVRSASRHALVDFEHRYGRLIRP